MDQVPAPQLRPGLPLATLRALAELAQVPSDRFLGFAGYVQMVCEAARYMAWSEQSRHPMLPSDTKMGAVAKALRGTVAALGTLGDAEAFALLGHREQEPAHAVSELAAYLRSLATTAERTGKPPGRPPKTHRVVGCDLLDTHGRPLSAAEFLTFELYRAAHLNAGALGRDKQRGGGTLVRAWRLIEPHTSLKAPSVSRIGELITYTRRHMGLDVGGRTARRPRRRPQR